MTAFILVCWLSIRPTINAYYSNKKYKKEQAQAQTAPQEIAKYQQAIASMKATNVKVGKDALFEVVSNFAAKNKLVIKALGEPDITVEGNYKIATHKIEVEGTFETITKLIYELEQVKRIGNVVSTTYEKQKDRRQKKTKLGATIYLQHVDQQT